jgi:hypothetical protein
MGRSGNNSKKNSSKGNGANQKDFTLWISIGLVVLVTFGVRFLNSREPDSEGSPSPSSESTSGTRIITSLTVQTDPVISTATPTHTIMPTAHSTISTSIPTSTPTLTPTSTIKTPVPTNFTVGPWHDNSPGCHVYRLDTTIDINGLELYGSEPPYKITFWQYGRIIDYKVINSPVDEKLEFTDPVKVDKGHYVHVIISFYKAGQEFTWNGDLYYYQDDPRCTSK